jgi:hypothetical protein
MVLPQGLCRWKKAMKSANCRASKFRTNTSLLSLYMKNNVLFEGGGLNDLFLNL